MFGPGVRGATLRRLITGAYLSAIFVAAVPAMLLVPSAEGVLYGHGCSFAPAETVLIVVSLITMAIAGVLLFVHRRLNLSGTRTIGLAAILGTLNTPLSYAAASTWCLGFGRLDDTFLAFVIGFVPAAIIGAVFGVAWLVLCTIDRSFRDSLNINSALWRTLAIGLWFSGLCIVATVLFFAVMARGYAPAWVGLAAGVGVSLWALSKIAWRRVWIWRVSRGGVPGFVVRPRTAHKLPRVGLGIATHEICRVELAEVGNAFRESHRLVPILHF